MKKLNKFSITLFIALLFACSSSSAQNRFYIVDWHGNLEKVDLAACDTTFIATMTYVMFDIAITPDNRLYGIEGPNFFEIDTQTAVCTFIAQFPALNCNALVSDAAGNLLTVSAGCLYQIDRFAGTANCIGFIGYSSSGDLTFYHDTLYLSANPNLLVKITMSPVSAQLVDTMYATSIFGINTVCLNGTETMIAEGGNINYGTLYIVNPANASLTVLCDSIIRNQIYGATSKMDFINEENCFTTGVNIATADDDIIVYPNPVYNALNVSIANSEVLTITVTDITSKLLITKKFTLSASFNLENLSAGIYFYQIRNKQRIIKQGKIFKQQ